MKEMLFLIFLAVAAWQDMRDKEIDAWLYVVFGGLIWFGKLCFDGPVELWREAVNAVPGIALVLLSRLSGGAVGEGDGWFFVVAGVALGVWNAVALFFMSLFLCCLWCAQRFRFLRFVLIPLLFCFRNQFGILCFFCHFRFGFIESVLFIHGNASFSHSFLHAAVYKNNVSGIHLNYVKIHVF